jgi:RNA polymerase sigma-70 factor (ECF subfamily)
LKINYQDADGRFIELEVTEEVGQFYLDSLEEEKNNNRKETRRHTSLSEFEWEDSDYFTDTHNPIEFIADTVGLAEAIKKLSPSQQVLIREVFFEGKRPLDLARREGIDKSSMSHRIVRAIKSLRKNFQ